MASIAEVFVNVGLKGWDRVKAGFTQMKAGWADIKDKVEATSKKAQLAFAGMTAGILGFTRAASPRVFDEFSASLKILSASLGVVFIPLVRQATGWLMQLAQWFYGLSSAQRGQIAFWTKLALGVTGFLILLPKIVVLGNLAWQTLTLLFTTPAGPIIAALAAVAAGIKHISDEITRLDSIASKTLAEYRKVEAGKMDEEEYKQSGARTRVMQGQSKAERQRLAEEEIKAAQAQINQVRSAVNERYGNSFGVGPFTMGNLRRGLAHYSGRHDKDLNAMREAQLRLRFAHQVKKEVEGTADQELDPAHKLGGVIGMRGGAGGSPKEKDQPKGSVAEGYLAGLGNTMQSPQLGSIASAWSRLQTAQIEGPEARLMREFGLTQKHTNALLEQISKQQLKPTEIKGGV